MTQKRKDQYPALIGESGSRVDLALEGGTSTRLERRPVEHLQFACQETRNHVSGQVLGHALRGSRWSLSRSWNDRVEGEALK